MPQVAVVEVPPHEPAPARPTCSGVPERIPYGDHQIKRDREEYSMADKRKAVTSANRETRSLCVCVCLEGGGPHKTTKPGVGSGARAPEARGGVAQEHMAGLGLIVRREVVRTALLMGQKGIARSRGDAAAARRRIRPLCETKSVCLCGRRPSPDLAHMFPPLPLTSWGSSVKVAQSRYPTERSQKPSPSNSTQKE